MATDSRSLSLDEYALIIEHVAAKWDPKSALNNLCLTHRSFVPLCQRYIFASITIPCSSPKVDTFPDIFHTSLHVFDYIKSFYYELDDTCPPEPIRTRRNENTASLLEKLHDLDFLSVIGPKPYEVRWGGIDSRITNALLRLMHSPGLRSLQLERIRYLPLDSILGFKNSRNLTTLSFSALDMAKCEGLSSSPFAMPQLSKFSAFARTANAVSTLVVGKPTHADMDANPLILDIPRLREIYTEWEDEEDKAAGFLLIGSASQLENLLCVLPKNTVATFEGLAMPILKGPSQTLRMLKLYASEPDENDEEPFLGSVPELQRLAGGKMKSLECIDMNFNLFTSDSVRGPKRLCRAINAGCKSLDSFFADRDAFPSLSSLSISFLVSILNDLEYRDSVLEQLLNVPEYEYLTLKGRFNDVSRRIRQQSFKSLDGIPSINLSFRLEMEWTDE